MRNGASNIVQIVCCLRWTPQVKPLQLFLYVTDNFHTLLYITHSRHYHVGFNRNSLFGKRNTSWPRVTESDPNSRTNVGYTYGKKERSVKHKHGRKRPRI